MSIASVITQGFGSFGTVNLVVTDGYGSGEAAPEPPAAAAGPTPAGRSSGRREQERRRYFLPDGTLVWATASEIDYLLRKFLVKEEPTPVSRGRRTKIVRTPAAEIEIEWRRADTAGAPAYAAVLPPQITWAPDPAELAAAMRMFQTMVEQKRLAEEEFAALLLLL